MAASSRPFFLAALAQAKPGVSPSPLQGGFFLVEGVKVHARLKRGPSGRRKYPFNYSPTSLLADYELWVCGMQGDYYLIPTPLLRQMHDDPRAYPDNSRPNLRIATVDLDSDLVVYGRGGASMSFRSFRNARL